MKFVSYRITMNPIRHTIWSLLLLICMLFGSELYAQAPEAINYQAIARDTSGQILASQGIALSLSVYSGPLGDTLVYVEDHLVSTNAYGLFTLQIGEGTPATGTFAGINWGAADHFLEVSIDVGNGAVNLGKRRFNSVPYALFAAKSEKATAMSLDDLLDADTTGALTGDVLKWDGLRWAPGIDMVAPGVPGVVVTPRLSGDGTGTDPLDIAQQGATLNQVLKWNGTDWAPAADAGTAYTAGTAISITGNTINNTGDTNPSDDITISTAAGGDLFGTYPSPEVVRIRGISIVPNAPTPGQVLKYDGVQWDVDADEINDADSNPTNEIQALSITGNLLQLSNGGGLVNLPTYLGGVGVSVTGTIINNTGDINPNDDITTSTLAQGDLGGLFPDPTVVAIQNNPVASGTPNSGDIMTWNGANWEYGPDPDNDPTNELQTLSITGTTMSLSNGGGSVVLPYTGGAGIAISGSIITNTGDTDPNDDITTSTAAGGDLSGIYPSPTVVSLQGSPIASTTPIANQVLTWSGAQWTPAVIPNSNLWTQNTTDLYFNTGNVSIGTNSSVSTLSVAGSSSVLNGTNQIRVENGIQAGAGFVQTTGNNGTTNTVLSNRAGSTDNGFIAVYDSTGALKAGMMVNAAGDGEIFGDFKNFRVAHPTDPEKEIWYASLEGPEAAAYLRGTATLENGTAEVSFPDHFQLIVQEAGMTVMLTPLSADSKGLAVVAKSDGGFEVKELLKGSGNYSFDWEVKSIRKGHEDFDIIRNRIPDLQN